MATDTSDSRLPALVVALRPGRYRLRLELSTAEDNRTLMAFSCNPLAIETWLQGQQLLEGLEKARRELKAAIPYRDDG